MKTKFVIASLLFMATILGSVSVFVKMQADVKKEISKESAKENSDRSLPIESGEAGKKGSKQNRVEIELDKEIAESSERLAQIKHELKAAGFPAVLSDERLSEAEREEIIAKLNNASDLQIKVTKLKIKKIDLLGEEDL